MLIDTHVDTPWQQRKTWGNLSKRHGSRWGAVDFPRMREGGVSAAFFVLYAPPNRRDTQLLVSRQLAWIYNETRACPYAVLVRRADSIRRAKRDGKIAILLGLEGGHLIYDDISVLRDFYDSGVRYITLTHSLNNNWADSSTEEPRHNGLTGFGRQVVREMNRLGMMVDISHVSDKTFYDVLAVSRAPLIASHSSCRALCNHPRNLSDDQIKTLVASGGVICITAARRFLGGNSWTRILDHIEHAVGLVGPMHVGLGSDFDGAAMPEGFDSCLQWRKVIEGLRERGWEEDEIILLSGGNVLRVMEQVE